MLENFFDEFESDDSRQITFYPVDKNRTNTEKRLKNLLFSFDSFQRIDDLLKDSPIEELVKKGKASTMHFDYYEEMYYILMDISDNDYQNLKYDGKELTFERLEEFFNFMINFFIGYEDYEKCADLQKVVKLLNTT